MAINYTDFYVDPVDGDDANDGSQTGGSSGVGPWRTLQHAWNNVDYNATRLNLSNKAEFDLNNVRLTWPAARSYDRPVMVTVWDNGGATGLTQTSVTGEEIPVYVINGQATAGQSVPPNLFETTYLGRFWNFRQGHFKRASNYIAANQYWQTWIDCFFSEGSSSSQFCLQGQAGTEGHIERCKFFDNAGGAIYLSRGSIKSCIVEDCGHHLISPGDWATVSDCILVDPPANRSALYISKRGTAIVNNTIIETNSAANAIGINLVAGVYQTLIKYNLLVGFEGTGSEGMKLSGWLTDIGPNAFYITGSGVNYNTSSNYYADSTSQDTILTSNPFVDGNSVAPYKLDPESDAYASAVGSQPYDEAMSYGAHQPPDGGGGGGGGGTTDTNGPLAWNDGVSA